VSYIIFRSIQHQLPKLQGVRHAGHQLAGMHDILNLLPSHHLVLGNLISELADGDSTYYLHYWSLPALVELEPRAVCLLKSRCAMVTYPMPVDATTRITAVDRS
jgi:hypothetical protein